VNRRSVTQDLGAGRQRTRVIITSTPCADAGPQAEQMKSWMLMTVASSPDITACGFQSFQKLKMFHDGTAWVIEVEATGDVPQQGG
jgi:hypothetical protein